MAEVVDHTLEMLRRIDKKMDRVLAELGGLKPRVSAMEVQLGELVTAVGRVNERIDGVDVRLDRIERRLDLKDGEKE